jgi:hypothetical protein
LGSTKRLRYIYLAYFSRPKADRPLFRLVRRAEPRRIVEIGLASIERTIRVIGLAEARLGGARVDYTLVDDFEDARGKQGAWSLREVYRRLRRTRARIRLVPGSPLEALRRTANSLGGTDLILLSRVYDAETFESAWFYVPRMLHARSLFVIESGGTDAVTNNARHEASAESVVSEHRFETVPFTRISRLAAHAARARYRRAA